MRKLRQLRYPRNPVDTRRLFRHLDYLLRKKEEEAFSETLTLIQLAQQKQDQELLNNITDWIKRNRLRIRGISR